MKLKNIARPVRVYALHAATPAERQGTRPLLCEKAAQERLHPRLSIVVLSFANMSGDSEQEYFVNGLTVDLTTEMSRMPGAFVIARNIAVTCKSKAADVKVMGRDLGVRCALEGSARNAGAASISMPSLSIPKPVNMCGRTASVANSWTRCAAVVFDNRAGGSPDSPVS